MRKALRLVVCLLSLSLLLTVIQVRADAQSRREKNNFVAEQSEDFSKNFSSSSTSRSRRRASRRNEEVEASIYSAIQARLGAPYRPSGTDERGYDCSGFVWSVFQAAGIDLTRTSARTLWQTLPEATEEEATQFGTLVFFRDLNHVGIVRDEYSFYHASTSQGVVRSFYSGYWADRVIGFRRVPLSKDWEVAGRFR